MTKKKRFGLSQHLNQGLKETISAVENHSGAVRYEVIALARIETDPENPRDLAITPEEITRGVSLADGLAKEKQEELDRLRSLAETIKKNGLINPIVVYKHSEKYRLVAGERRYLASLLAGQGDIQARVLSTKPDNVELKLLQWIENTEREDLSLKDRIGNIHAIISEYKKQHLNSMVTATTLKELISISLSQATAYMAVVNAPADVQEAIALGKINNLDKAAYLAKITAPEMRKNAIAACIEGTRLKDVKTLIETEINATKPLVVKIEKKRGRAATMVSMGTTKKPHIVKKIVEFVTEKPLYSHLSSHFISVNWNDYMQVTKAFKKLIQILEREVEN